jgi:hypothetical protein
LKLFGKEKETTNREDLDAKKQQMAFLKGTVMGI